MIYCTHVIGMLKDVINNKWHPIVLNTNHFREEVIYLVSNPRCIIQAALPHVKKHLWLSLSWKNESRIIFMVSFL